MKTADQINSPQLGRIDVKTSDERDEDQRIEIANLKAQLDAANKAILDWENREASVCPENTPFEKVIEQLRTQGAETREALTKTLKDLQTTALFGAQWTDGTKVDFKPQMDLIEHALSSNCGKGYVSKEQVKGLREALRSFVGHFTEEDTAHLATRHPGASAGEMCVKDVLTGIKVLAATKDLQ